MSSSRGDPEVGRPEKVRDALTAGYAVAVARGPGLVDAVLEATGGRKVDVVLDPHGTDWLDADLELLAPGGRVVLFGNAAGGGLDLLPPAGRLIGGNISVAGFSHRRLAAEAPATVRAAMAHSIDLLDKGDFGLAVTVVDDLAEIAAVHQLLADGRGTGKYVVRVGRAG